MPASSWRSAAKLVAVLLVLGLAGSALPLLPLVDPLNIDLAQRLVSPHFGDAILGTDELGRDVLSRTLHGLGLTLRISVATVIASLAVGVLLGALSGGAPGGALDRLLSWIASLLLSIPFLLILAALVALQRPGLLIAYLALAGIIWIHPFRVVRAEVSRRLGRGYVLSARALGYSQHWVVWRKLVPRAFGPAVVVSFTYLPEVIALEAGLSFFGLGAQPPAPSLGRMLFEGLPYLFSAWWITVAPALALFVLVLLVNLLLLGMMSHEHKKSPSVLL